MRASSSQSISLHMNDCLIVRRSAPLWVCYVNVAINIGNIREGVVSRQTLNVLPVGTFRPFAPGVPFNISLYEGSHMFCAFLQHAEYTVLRMSLIYYQDVAAPRHATLPGRVGALVFHHHPRLLHNVVTYTCSCASSACVGTGVGGGDVSTQSVTLGECDAGTLQGFCHLP